MLKFPAIVEDAEEINPPYWDARPATLKVEEADNGPANCKELEMVEEAVERSPAVVIVPVAVIFATLIILPENKALP